MGETKRTETEHRWHEYGRWFYGHGSSMNPHRCGHPSEPCQKRTRTVTVIEGDWSNWEPTNG